MQRGGGGDQPVGVVAAGWRVTQSALAVVLLVDDEEERQMRVSGVEALGTRSTQ